MKKSDRDILRDLAKQYRDVCDNPVQNVRRDLWRHHNSLQRTRPLIYVRAFAWHELPQATCYCEGWLNRTFEDYLRRQLFWAALDDDSIFEPWFPVSARFKCYSWGIEIKRMHSGVEGGAFKIDYPLKEPADIAKMRMPWHEVDEVATAEVVACAQEMFGDILPIALDRSTPYKMWGGDISTELGHLRGIENFMLDMCDNPEWLHQLTGFMSSGILKVHKECEAAGDWNLLAHQNQAMPYALELPDPAPDSHGVKQNRLWGYMAAQEFTGISPAMHDEFLLQHQLPMLKRFGLVAYGCCENLTQKIEMLRQIPNLRRIGVSPMADVAACAAQIGQDYVLSYRPSPADMVSYGFDAERARRIMTRDLEFCRDTHVDITLKDVETVEHQPERVSAWVKVAREVIDAVFG